MKIGIIPVNIGVQSVDQMVGLSRHAESLGYESVWTFEHVIVPLDYRSKYPYNASGKMGATPETNFVDPLIALAAIAGATERIRLGTGVNILSQTNPLLAAKQAASLDFVSKGRFMYGIGIGWLEEEFDAMGVPFERRGARFDDYVVAMRKVWSGEVVEHESEFLSWHGFKSHPVPVQKPLPLVMGGSKGRIYERIARYGNGWYAPTGSPAELAPMLEELKKVCARVGRDYASIEITTMWSGQGGREAVAAFEKIGVQRLVVLAAGLGADPLQGLTELARTVIR
jgi:probable F420-dependent oxidoreductase